MTIKRIVIAAVIVSMTVSVEAAGQPDVGSVIRCEGEYPWHLQGTATDGEYLYWSFSDCVIKTDRAGKRLCSSPASKLHYGDLCAVDGKVYVAFNGGEFK